MKRAYQINEFYTLDQIRGLTDRLKTIVSKSTPIGLIHLYREKDTNFFWLGGPLKGAETNLFLYLGTQQSKEEALSSITSAMNIVFNEQREQNKEFSFDPHHYDLYTVDDWLDFLEFPILPRKRVRTRLF